MTPTSTSASLLPAQPIIPMGSAPWERFVATPDLPVGKGALWGSVLYLGAHRSFLEEGAAQVRSVWGEAASLRPAARNFPRAPAESIMSVTPDNVRARIVLSALPRELAPRGSAAWRGDARWCNAGQRFLTDPVRREKCATPQERLRNA